MSEIRQLTREESIMKRRGGIYSTGNIFSKNNKVWINGVIEEKIEYSHTSFETDFYKTKVKVKRHDDDKVDYIPIMMSEKLRAQINEQSIRGKYVEIGGRFHSFSEWGQDNKKHLKLFLFAKVLNIYESELEFEEEPNTNVVYLEGYICKNTIYHETLAGNKTTDLMIAVNSSKASSYIPCVAIDEDAQYAKDLVIGNKIKLYGIVQSRLVLKFKPGTREIEEKEVYEILIKKFRRIREI